MCYLSDERKAKLEVRSKPVLLERVAGFAQLVEHFLKVLRDEMRQHETIVQGRAPADRPLAIWLFPHSRHQRPQQQLLCQAHPRVRRHLETAEFDQAQPAGGRVGREQLVDAELGAMRVAGQVDQQVAQHAVDNPRLSGFFARQLRQRRLQLVDRLVPAFVGTRGLAGRADK